jgi:fibronectin type 3 domain-containing protein
MRDVLKAITRSYNYIRETRGRAQWHWEDSEDEGRSIVGVKRMTVVGFNMSKSIAIALFLWFAICSGNLVMAANVNDLHFQEMDGYYLDGHWVNTMEGVEFPSLVSGVFVPGQSTSFLLSDRSYNFLRYFPKEDRGDGVLTNGIYSLKRQGWEQAGFLKKGVALSLIQLDENNGSDPDDLAATTGTEITLYRNTAAETDLQPHFLPVVSLDTKIDQVSVASGDMSGNGLDDLLVLKWRFMNPELFVIVRPEGGWSSLDVNNLNLISLPLPELLPVPNRTVSVKVFKQGGDTYVFITVDDRIHLYRIDYTNANPAENKLAELVQTENVGWFAGVPSLLRASYCFFDGSVDDQDGAYLVQTETNGVNHLFRYDSGLNKYTKQQPFFLYADYGRLSSPVSGEFFDSNGKKQLLVGYNAPDGYTYIAAYFASVMDRNGKPTLELTTIPEGSNNDPFIPLQVKAGTMRTGSLTSWSEHPDDLFDSIFYSSYYTGVAFVENSLSRLSSHSNELRVSDFSLPKSGSYASDSYAGFIADYYSETRSVVRFCDLDLDGDEDGVVFGDYSGFKYYENIGNAGSPSFSEKDGANDPFGDLNVSYSTVTFFDLDGDSDPDLISIFDTPNVYSQDSIIRAGQISVVWNEGIYPYTNSVPQFSGSATDWPLDVADEAQSACYPLFTDLNGDSWRDLVVGYETGGLRIWINQHPPDIYPPTAPNGDPNASFMAKARNGNLVQLDWHPMVDNLTPDGFGTGIKKYKVIRYDQQVDPITEAPQGDFQIQAASFVINLPGKLEIRDDTAQEYHNYIYVLQAQDRVDQWSVPNSFPDGMATADELPAGSIYAEAQTRGPVVVDTITATDIPEYVSANWTCSLAVTYGGYEDPEGASATVRIVKDSGPANVSLKFSGPSGDIDSWIIDGTAQVSVPLHVVVVGEVPAEGAELSFHFEVVQETPIDSNSKIIKIDLVAPEGAAPSAQLTYPGNQTSKSITVSWGSFVDSGAGLNAYTLTREIWDDVSQSYKSDAVFGGLLATSVQKVDGSSSILYGHTYRYTLMAVDEVGNTSALYVSNDVTTPENLVEPPSPAPDITLATAGDGYVHLEWQRSEPRATGATSVWYKVYRRLSTVSDWGAPIRESLSQTSFDDYGDLGQTALPEGTYYYYVEAYDSLIPPNSVNGSTYGPVTVAGQTAALDHITISGPSSVNENSGAQYSCTAYFADNSSQTVTSQVSWSENSPYTSISSGGYLSTSLVSSNQNCTITASYTTGGITKSDTQAVTIVNSGGVTPPDNVGSIFLIQTDYNSHPGSCDITFHWYSPSDATWFDIERRQDGGDWLIENPHLEKTSVYMSYTDTVSVSGTYIYRIKAGNSAGTSPDWVESREIPVDLGSTTVFLPPSGLSGEELAGPTIRLSWTGVDENTLEIYVYQEVEGAFGSTYDQFKDLSVPVSEHQIDLSEDVDGAPFQSGKTYTFVLKAKSTSGEMSAPSDSYSITVSGSGQVTYSITASAGDGGSIDPSGTVSVVEGASKAFTISPNAGYGIEDVLVDGSSAGAISAYTFENVSANHAIEARFQQVEDNTPPDAPTGLYVRSSGSGGTDIAFTPSEDNPGGTGIKTYHIYRNGSELALEPTLVDHVHVFVDTGVQTGDTVEYYMIAEDNAGLQSDPSESIKFDVPYMDNTPPTVPLGLVAEISSDDTLQIQLKWDFSIDRESGVSVYEIFRTAKDATRPVEGDAPTAISRFTQWVDGNAVPGSSYTYWIQARDMGGNLSGFQRVSVDVPSNKATSPLYTAYFPHRAISAIWWTGFSLVNTGKYDTTWTFHFYDADGIELKNYMLEVPVKSGGKIVATIKNLFKDNFDLENAPENLSWWDVESTQPMEGFELFGGPSDDGSVEQMAGVKMAKQGATQLLYPVMKVDEDHWTGIALINVGTAQTSVSMIPYDSEGRELRSSLTIPVNAMGKIVKLAEDFFADNTLPPGTALLVLKADQPCIGFELFGKKDHSGLAGVSAVPLASDETPFSKADLSLKGSVSNPTNLRVLQVNGTTATLGWDASAGNPDTYRVYEVDDSSPFGTDIIAFLGETETGSQTQIDISGLDENRTYDVAVVAVEAGVESDLSNIETFMTGAEITEIDSYGYMISRPARMEDMQQDWQIELHLVNLGAAAADVEVRRWPIQEGEPYMVQIPAGGKAIVKLDESGLALDENTSAIQVISTRKLICCEVFEAPEGYYDSLFAFTGGQQELTITHTAQKTDSWRTHLGFWNLSPYYNTILLNLVGQDENGDPVLLDTAGTTDSNPVQITLSPFSSSVEEIHNYLKDENIQRIEWIRAVGQFPINGYFSFGQPGAFHYKITAVECE